MRVLGLSALYHDSAAALVEDGRIVAAVQEERFSRKKHDARMPKHAIAACLDIGRIALKDIDLVAFYEKPFVKFERLLETYAALAPQGFTSFRRAVPLWIKEKLFQKDALIRDLKAMEPSVNWAERLVFSEHHASHAASAFFPSPFEEAAVLTLDGVGEWCTTSLAYGNGARLEIQREIHFPHSLGLLYSAFTYYTGFKVNSGEYKVMGLAPYGTPRFTQTILDHLIDLKSDGSFRLDQSYFDYCTGLTMTNARFDALFGGPPRKPSDPPTQRDMDLAASVQAVTDEVVMRLARSIRAETGARNLCLAGGVALNCVANGKIAAEGLFDRLWVQPAAGDAGGALGAALAAFHLQSGGARTPRHAGDDMQGGAARATAFAQAEIERALGGRRRALSCVLDDDGVDRPHRRSPGRQRRGGVVPGPYGVRPARAGRALDPEQCGFAQHAAHAQSQGQVPRELPPLRARRAARGRRPVVRARHRQPLHAAGGRRARRQAPAAQTGEDGTSSASTNSTFRVREIPAVTHVDYSARVQTVEAAVNPRFHALIAAFAARTGIPVLVNTSFNVRGEPIVCTPEDAFRCFMATDLDGMLAIGNCLARKGAAQDPALKTRLPAVHSSPD